MAEFAIEARGLGKRYRIGHERQRYARLTDSLADGAAGALGWLLRRPRIDSEWFWALKDVSFELRHGDVLGVIGRNGAGKSTLLKILSRITEPSEGEARLFGRVGSLLEVGTGFHPELSGRENIFLNGSILGLSRAEIRRRFDEIVDFAGVEQFLDTPVKRYSSGMRVRLGFAVAAYLETEILIVDEVLAVGDVAFQNKSLAKMEDVAQAGRTVLFVSHNMAAVETICNRGILLDRGRIITTGSAREVVGKYLRSAIGLTAVDISERPDRQGDGRLRFQSVESDVRTGAPSEIRFSYRARAALGRVAVSVGIFNSTGEGAAFLGTEIVGHELGSMPEQGVVVCRLPMAPLLPGRYTMNVFCTVNDVIADWVIDAAQLEVTEGDFFGSGRLPPAGYGSVAVPHSWAVE